ncbi:MAG: hypothetical protein KJO34_11450 [Deltaproteobacteria bacterium]|nr:hypothetical protein [Deltaproteobacteria bacterium]
MKKYEICSLGSGPGGFAPAMRDADLGKKVCIIEGGEIGAAGVKWGALASKSRWELAKDFAIAANRGYPCAYEIQLDRRHLYSISIKLMNP